MITAAPAIQSAKPIPTLTGTIRRAKSSSRVRRQIPGHSRAKAQQYGRGEDVRGDVEHEEELRPRGDLAEELREHIRRRHVQEKGREHEVRGLRGAEEAVEAEQPRPGLAAAGDEQEERGDAEPDEMVCEEEGHVAVLAMVVAPEPREEEKRRGDLNRGDGAEDARAPTREGAPGRSGPGRRRVPRGVAAQDGRRYGAEIIERPAVGRSG